MTDYEIVMDFIKSKEVELGRRLDVEVIDLAEERRRREEFFSQMEKADWGYEDKKQGSIVWTPGMRGTKE